jgi:peptide/nickel transport system permease protein
MHQRAAAIARLLLGGIARVLLIASLVGACSFLTIYRPVLRLLWEAVAGALALAGAPATTLAPVVPPLLRAYGHSMLVIVGALGLALLIGVPAGVLAGLRPDHITGSAIRLLGSAGTLMPTFILAMAVLVFFVMVVLPATGIRFVLLATSESAVDPRRMLPLVLTLAARPLAHLIAASADAVADVWHAPFMHVARSRGLAPAALVWRHALPHVALRVVAALPPALLFAIGSLPIVEYLFSWPGVGLELLRSIVDARTADLTGTTLVAALATSLAVTYAAAAGLAGALQRRIDPRLAAGVDR